MDVIKAKDIDSKEFKKHILSFYTNHESGYNVVHSEYFKVHKKEKRKTNFYFRQIQ